MIHIWPSFLPFFLLFSQTLNGGFKAMQLGSNFCSSHVRKFHLLLFSLEKGMTSVQGTVISNFHGVFKFSKLHIYIYIAKTYETLYERYSIIIKHIEVIRHICSSVLQILNDLALIKIIKHFC